MYLEHSQLNIYEMYHTEKLLAGVLEKQATVEKLARTFWRQLRNTSGDSENNEDIKARVPELVDWVKVVVKELYQLELHLEWDIKWENSHWVTLTLTSRVQTPVEVEIFLTVFDAAKYYGLQLEPMISPSVMGITNSVDNNRPLPEHPMNELIGTFRLANLLNFQLPQPKNGTN